MHTNIRSTYRRSSHHTIEVSDDDFEAELVIDFEPCSDPLVEVRENKIVAAFLVHDSDAGDSPMEDGCAMGDLYTKRPYSARDQRVTDNDSELLGALGLDSYGAPDIDLTFKVGGEKTTLRDLAVIEVLAKIITDGDMQAVWMDYTLDGNEEGVSFEEWLKTEIDLRMYELTRDLEDSNGCFSEEVGSIAFGLYPKHWEAIAGPYVVPVAAGLNNYWPTSWDGDVDDLPDGVWVADKDSEENIKASGQTAHEYVTPILEEYSAWCEGEVFGCVVNLFEKQDGEWVMTRDESCWRFIGRKWAEQALKEEFFDPFVEEHLETVTVAT